LLRGVGAAAEGFAARQLTEQMLRETDLVLALTRRHRSRVVELYPGIVRRTFILRELARLVGAVDQAALPAGSESERLAALLPLAAAQRGLHRPQAPDADDVVDPWGGDDALYRRAFDQVRPAVAEIARVVRG
jgi:protein-tyrosine phosphatase